jgi:hypothetical protein
MGEEIRHDGFTTIANWRGYGSVEHRGEFYGQKVHSFRRFFDLPIRTSERMMPAIAIHSGETKDLASFAEYGWQLLDPAVVASNPKSYREFIRGSKAEIGIAKSGYVASRCGWFSDRSACYLAAGRPVLAQNTGFSAYLPVGEGLIPFDSMEDILMGIDAINAEMQRHRRAARGLAEEYFSSEVVLTRLLKRLGA